MLIPQKKMKRHLMASIFIAPVLAALSWFAVDIWVSPEKTAAQPGAVYPLVAKSKCRYSSGRCPLKNGDINVVLRISKPVLNRKETNHKSSLQSQKMRFQPLLLEVGDLPLKGARIEWLDINQMAVGQALFSPFAVEDSKKNDIAGVNNGTFSEKKSSESHTWYTSLPTARKNIHSLRLAMTIGHSHYFVETSTAFIKQASHTD